MRGVMSGLPRIGAVSVLVVAAFLGGWFLSPNGALSGLAASSGQEAAVAGRAGMNAMHGPSDEMRELCARHMAEMRPVMDEMMRNGMHDMTAR